MKDNLHIMRLVYLLKKCYDDDIISLASQVTYSLMLAFFPFLFLVLTFINNSIIEREYIFTALSKIVPKDTYYVIYNTTMEIMFKRQGGRAITITLFLSIWMATLGFSAVIKSLNKSYNENEKRTFFKRMIISIISTFGLAFIIAVALSMLVFGQSLWSFAARLIGIKKIYDTIWHFIRYTITFSFMILTVSWVYKFAPSKRLTFREVGPGALFTTISWIIVSMGFSYYVNTFAAYSRLYGSIAAVIVLMVWLFLCSLILLFGGELNAALKLKKL